MSALNDFSLGLFLVKRWVWKGSRNPAVIPNVPLGFSSREGTDELILGTDLLGVFSWGFWGVGMLK